MMSYGGIWINEAYAAQAVARMSCRDAFGFFRAPSLSSDTDPRAHLTWFLERGVQPGTFYNPWGASRWGYAHLVVDQAMLNQFRQRLEPEYKALPFAMNDASGNSLSTDLWMLPAIPLQKMDPQFNLFLLPLVDDRYFWWEKATDLLRNDSGTVRFEEGTTTWYLLLNWIATGLGIPLATDVIAADYLKPSLGIVKSYDYLPQVMDWACASIGHRLVRTLDGKYRTRTAQTAIRLMKSQSGLYRKFAGGALDLGVVNA